MRNGGRIISLEFQPLKNLGRPVLKATAITETSQGRGESLDLLVKLHNPNVPPQTRPKSSGEAYFYKFVASRSRVPTPETYIAEFDEQMGRLLIVQEFLTNGRIGTAETMLNANDQKRVLAALGKMHAHWWNSPELAQLHGIRTGKAAFQHGMELFESGAYDGNKFLSRFADQVHPVIANYYGASTPWGPEIRDGFSFNTTLCHFDCSAKNIFIPDDQSQDPVLFDWGQVIRANVGIEIAQFLFSTTDTTAPNRFPDLVRYYHHQLLAGGVTGYTYGTLWDDFRYGCLVRLAAPIALASRGNPAGDEIALTLLPLITSAVLATNALELLDPSYSKPHADR